MMHHLPDRWRFRPAPDQYGPLLTLTRTVSTLGAIALAALLGLAAPSCDDDPDGDPYMPLIAQDAP